MSEDTNAIQDMFVQEYSAKALVIRGNTKVYKDQLKQLGGKYNSRLRDGDSSIGTSPGWIFSKSKSGSISKFLETGEMYEEEDGETAPVQVKVEEKVITPKKIQPLGERRAAPAACPHCAELKKEVGELNRKVDKILGFFDKSEQLRKNMMAGAGSMMKNIFGATAEMMNECASDAYVEEMMEPPPSRPHVGRIMRPPPSVTVLEEDYEPAAVLLDD